MDIFRLMASEEISTASYNTASSYSRRYRRMRALRFIVGMLVLLLLVVIALMPAPRATSALGSSPPESSDTIWLEVFAPDNTISRILVPAPAPLKEPLAPLPATFDPIQIAGPTSNRLNLVFVGDGYTSAELPLYEQHVQAAWQRLIGVEPFKTYQQHFNVYRVNVVSPESGVDNDPTLGIQRTTALDMRFWCFNTERLLCVDSAKAAQYAANAPAVDYIVAIANSTKYGGAGGGTVATFSGGNFNAGQILIHELGHSIGKLADEYVLIPGHYSGPEVPQINASIAVKSSMLSTQTKWFRWMGEITPDGGSIDTYVGARHGDTGIYRPSQNSLMRTTGRQFNLPGREAMVQAFYAQVMPIDSSVPTNGAPLDGHETVVLTLVQPKGPPLQVTWRLDGQIISAADNQASLNLESLDLDGTHWLEVTVIDTTPFVRDPMARDELMTQRLSWTITRVTPTAVPTAVPTATPTAVPTATPITSPTATPITSPTVTIYLPLLIR